VIDLATDFDSTAVAFLALTLAVIAEARFPFRAPNRLTKRWLHNGALALLSYSFSYFCVTALALWGLVALERAGIPPEWHGLIETSPFGIQLFWTFLGIEFCRYGVHWLSHKIPLFWRFHCIHHADPEVDVTTAFRNHPFEACIGAIPMTLFVFVLGAPATVLLIYRAFDLSVTIFSHTNIRLPEKLEHLLSNWIVTPKFHRTHHFSCRTFTDSNYGAISPWFDYLFRTFQRTSTTQDADAELGLGWRDHESGSLLQVLLAPFKTDLPK